MVWVLKAADACARQTRTHGPEAVQKVWNTKGKDGPVAGLKVLLATIGVSVSNETWSIEGASLGQRCRPARLRGEPFCRQRCRTLTSKRRLRGRAKGRWRGLMWWRPGAHYTP